MMRRTVVFIAAVGIAAGMASSAKADTLVWNGARGARWNDANWLDAGNNPIAWQDGADAVFPGGAFVEVQDSVRPASITFTGNGATLVGAGRIVLPGDLTASVAGTTNSIVAKLVGDATFTKRGAGAVAVSFAKGFATVAEGTLLIAGSRSANLRATATGGAVEALGGATSADNLLQNASFENTAVTDSRGYTYVVGKEQAGTGIVDKEGTSVAPWKASDQVVLSNATGLQPWTGSNTTIPDGNQLCILQRFGSIMQEVTVAEAGWYDISFIYFKRAADHRISLLVDDVMVTSILANMYKFNPVSFSSGLLWLSAGTHTVRISGEGWWQDVATLLDDVRFGPPTACSLPQLTEKAANAVSGNWSSPALWVDGVPPSAGGSSTTALFLPLLDGLASVNDLSDTFLFNSLRFGGVASGESATLSGNALSSRRDASSHGYIYLDTPGALDISAPLTVNSNLVVDVEGDLTLVHSLNHALGEGAAIEKAGAGTLTLADSIANLGRLHVTEGTVEIRNPSANTMYFYLKSSSNVTAAVRFNISADATTDRFIDSLGAGVPLVSLRSDAGRTLIVNNFLNCYGPLTQVDVGAGDTLRLKGIMQATSKAPLGRSSLLKTGPGCLAVMEAGTVPASVNGDSSGNIGSIYGGITVREGFVHFWADDFGYGSGMTNIYTGKVFPANRDGSLGHSTDVPLMLGDAQTPAGATVGVRVHGTPHTCSARDYIATPYPAQVVIGAQLGGIYQMGTVVLRRGDLTLEGPTGTNEVNVMLTDVALDGVSAATISRSGDVRTILNAPAYPAGLTLVSDRILEVGFRRSLAVSIGTLNLSGAWQVSFDTAGNDSVSADSLVLGATEVSLWDDVSDQTFVAPGTFTLLRYGTLSGDVSSLSVAASSRLPGYTYTFADTGSAITLTITAAADNPVYTWTSATGGAWLDAANWDHPPAPDAATAQAVLGTAAQSDATVMLAAPVTVNALTFYNSHSYTLTGGTLKFDGADPDIFAAAGVHEIQNAVTNLSATPISVQSTEQGSVRFVGAVDADLAIERGRATFAQGMDLHGNVTVTGATLTVESGADIAGTATLGENARLVTSSAAVIDSLTSTDDSAAIVTDGALTLGGATSTYGGTISGTGSLVKDGASTLSLNNMSITHTGGTMVNAGTLAVGRVMLPGVTWLANGAALKASGVNHAVNGHYRGYYNKDYQTPYNNQVFSLADFEAMMALLTSSRDDVLVPLATTFAIGDTKENPFPSAYAGSQNCWVATYKANLIVPETGFYSFYTVLDDQVIFMIDDFKVLSSRANAQTYGGCYLEKGVHSFFVGLMEITGDAYVSLFVKQPSESAYKPLPAAWLVPDVGAADVAGLGALAPDAGTVVTVGQATGFSGFAGSIAGAAGGMVQKAGNGTLTARYVSGDVATRGGGLALAGATTFGTVRATETGTVHIVRGTIRKLSGDGKAVFGTHVYTIPRIVGDADSGFSTDKTYTHLVNFSQGSQVPVINGVTVNNTGSWSWGGTPPASTWGSDGGSAATGFERLVYRFIYGSMDFSVNLSGLAAGKLYDLRLYFRGFGTKPRPVTFVFSRSGVELGRVDWDPDLDENGARRPFTAVGCRYVADASGKVTVRVISHVAADKCHFYGFSNEQIGDVDGSGEAVSLVPAAGEKARLTGGISGTAALSLDGAGTQAFGGTNSLPAPLAVNVGRAVLENGSVVTAGVTVASGATLEMQGTAQVNGLSGAGTLNLSLGDNYPWGALQADGTFAASEWPHRVNVAGDADSGIAPFKKYTHFVNFGYDGSHSTQQVNGVSIFCSNGADANTTYYDMHRGGTFMGPPVSVHNQPNATQHNNIVMDSSNAMRVFFVGFQYAGNVTLTLDRLTAGKTYELRIYIRNWASQNRTIKLTYNDGTDNKSFTFNEDIAPDGYIALRYTPSGTSFTLKGDKQANDGFHIYAFSNEEVDSYVRTVNIDADATFSGAITGNGELRKTGAGTWTLTGTGTASGAWTVAEGALVLDGATATKGPVAVASGASFGGVGTAGGEIGVASGATLLLGSDNSAGTFAAGSNVVIAAGAAVTMRYASDGSCGALASAGSVTVPASLTVTASPLVAGTKLTRRVQLFAAETALNGPSDLSSWTAVDAEGAPLRGAKFTYGDDGKSIWLNAISGTIIYFR